MVRVDTAKWGQAVDDLRAAAAGAPHRRTRERFLALYVVASGTHNATAWAALTGREDGTVQGWVHRYNAGGPDALAYRRTGGSRPLFRPTGPRKSPPRPSGPGRVSTACPATCGP
jgi:hypothetical protein